MTQQTESNSRSRPDSKRTVLLSLASLLGAAVLAAVFLPFVGAGKRQTLQTVSVPDLGERYDALIAAEAEFAPVPPPEETVPGEQEPEMPEQMPPEVRRLSDLELAAPRPDPEKYGTAQAASELDWLAEQASGLLDGQSLLFGGERTVLPGSEIHYYLDDSLLVITWKEPTEWSVLTFAEVKIADGSQLRRYVSDGQYGSENRYPTTELAQAVNAVAACSGDSYKNHYGGTSVHEGTVRRASKGNIHTCYINEEGDLIFTYQTDFADLAAAQQFVEEEHIRFSLAFGPVLVDEGQRCEPVEYGLGEVNVPGPRGALCQIDSLHYLLITSNSEPACPGALDIHQFAQYVAQTGCQKAYTLTGGQSAAISLDGQVVNAVLNGRQRPVTDIIYFATSVSDGG